MSASDVVHELIRRIGGLEMGQDEKHLCSALIRRIGGLENRVRAKEKDLVLIRRIGGLEKKPPVNCFFLCILLGDINWRR